MTPGKRTRSLREGRKWSGPELAAAAEVHKSQVARLEADARMPEPRALLRIARALKTTVEWLLEGDDDPRSGVRHRTRDLACAVAREAGVSDDAVQALMTRAVRADERELPTLYWLDQIRAEEVRLRTIKIAPRSA